ncbi:MAG: SEC-C domain-containing protein [Dactylosporangium sp.]|nr:SEC-C domain-containing protein [Dactylosporangium sp.]NNJ61403.1 SEC-C domain-containing protein [Dactylosporangium sp.]
MPQGEPLTVEDLDTIEGLLSAVDDPLALASYLTEAAEQGLVTDQTETGRVLALAAKSYEQAGDLERAEASANAAIVADSAWQAPDRCVALAFRAGLLLRTGRETDGLAELEALRPLMISDPMVVSAVTEALVTSGRLVLAEQWVSTALRMLLPQPTRKRPTEELWHPDNALETIAIFTLAQHRRTLRFDLDQPRDAYDELADLLHDEIHKGLGEEAADECPFCEVDDDWDDADQDGTAILFWPEVEFGRLAARWPRLAEAYGGTWDGHRAQLQRALTRLSGIGLTRLALISGAFDELERHTAELGDADPDVETCEDYVTQIEDTQREIPWPPERNAPCWCGARRKYKRCCLHRAQPDRGVSDEAGAG